jgi:hypothetical protein
MSSYFEELDYRPTPIGALSLRRRRELSLEVDVFEIKLGDKYLMSSLFTASEIALAYKGKAVDVKRIARELGVRYVLEGSVRKSGNRVRITAQLIDAATGNHIWAERYDSELSDIFDLQDQVTARVVGAIAPKLEQVEIERAKRKPTESLDAYDHYLRGMANLHQWTKESSDEALRQFRRAIELDPGFASAYGMAAWGFVLRKANRWMADRAQEIAEAARQHEFRLKYRFATLDDAVEGGSHPRYGRMLHPPLDVSDAPASMALVPGTVESFGRGSKLDRKVVRQILWFGLAPLLAPQVD